ncbi:uncharacterized protein Gasu_20630 [Galdieria sulphuraria]|uniref:Uncharacterized protein n=1 Tax=Galdieria sulphuraria TaxID=130081 RepID=M2W4C0_GALSU|nr:uncharacterized protein Gasu_20630 [Galdieria sulphuraria]EME30601.1 hypothetical protein Gasu_20630 [Galdieria sulphuraria]|eukprot:XP_005707121.1 hypothetical protein Gasu_20630 [Galdieria sulphuraria]
MGRKVTRRRRKAYLESLIHNEKLQFEKQKEKKQYKEDKVLILDKLSSVQLDSHESTSSDNIVLQHLETEKGGENKIKASSKPITKRQRTKDRRRRQKIRNRMQQAVAMFSS